LHAGREARRLAVGSVLVGFLAEQAPTNATRGLIVSLVPI
jgi:hypothetical protein